MWQTPCEYEQAINYQLLTSHFIMFAESDPASGNGEIKPEDY